MKWKSPSLRLSNRARRLLLTVIGQKTSRVGELQEAMFAREFLANLRSTDIKASSGFMNNKK